MTRFRGCIDLHSGVVKQIVGGTLSDNPTSLQTNHTSAHPSSHFATLYRTTNTTGSHVIKLGPGCDEAAELALKTWPNGLQIGGGVNADNAAAWIEKGAEKVIVTSWLFPEGQLSKGRLVELRERVGRERVVVDLSCRVTPEGRWVVAMDRWQRLTDTEVCKETLDELSEYCSEFLIHAADVEGLCRGIDEKLVEALGKWVTIPTTYAGGAKSLEDLEIVQRLSNGKVDLTYGSALDIFGGDKVKFDDCVKWNHEHS
ncbi:Phosphoribosylformimino-5-aminoimidazole carboxamide ribotide isomerase [Ascodesmis nigricans]|uniref:1-(5-phosphoribosyl)-5-[(5-phosphoribosylamino)methylideneamino] imidazole-4-carboxamide isomerase n=1 Tax=Ascodesmis nigricans TaxID=341454 RepID=A0A4S2N6W9_9PEZI|nr:Phosphoribosylformimino-5-aminoimidazole carboxamide ribotide isomerase [Ascodesmis nigricans]